MSKRYEVRQERPFTDRQVEYLRRVNPGQDWVWTVWDTATGQPATGASLQCWFLRDDATADAEWQEIAGGRK